MSRLLRILLPTLLACGDRPAEPGTVNAMLDGNVFVTGPVTGVKVSAYELGLDTGAQGRLIAQSMPTDDQGAYHLDLGNYHGAVLLVAQGVGGAYVEPATGVTAHWDTSTELRAAFAVRTPDRDLRLALDSGEQATAIITPWSEWAFVYSFARLASKRDQTYAEALTHALERFRDHVELDYWNVVPAVMSTGPVGAWNNGVQAGLLLSALSGLTAELAIESQLSTAGMSSLELVAAVEGDLADPAAILDGIGRGGQLKVGTCPTLCSLGASTLRADLRDGAAIFLASPANKSGITTTDAAALLARLAARTGDLWSSPPLPTVSIVPSSFRDDNGVDVDVAGPAPGTVQYKTQGTVVMLAAGPPTSFVKFASRYMPDSGSLPEWHVTDNHNGDTPVTLTARLSRENSQHARVLLKDWFAVPAVTATGYNRALVLSSAVHPDIALVDGTYRLEYLVTDGLGNASSVDCAHGIGCVEWSQLLRSPPVRQRPGGDGDKCSEPAIPTGHVLGVGGPCPAIDNTASVNLTGPDNRKIAKGYIDNPNSIPVQVTISATAPSSVRRGLRFENIQIGDPVNVDRSCDNRGIDPVTPTGECHDVKSSTTEYGTDEILDRDLVSNIDVVGATARGTDAAGHRVYEIPPHSTATVWLESSPWRFLMPWQPTDYAAVGTIPFVTGYTGNAWRRCARIALEHYGDHELYCADQVLMTEFTQLTRVTIHPRSSVTLTTRPAGANEATWGPATGTDVRDFEYTDFGWDTRASGY